VRIVLVITLLAALAGAGCGGDDRESGDSVPRIVVTTNILGDVVENLVGDAAEVEVVMPPNADPHDFAASARQAASMRTADALVVNGLGFEEGLIDTVEAAEDDGVPVITAADAVEPLPIADGGDPRDDPHLFTDPVRVRQAAELIADRLAETITSLDTPAVEERVADYLAELDALHVEVEDLLAGIPDEDRLLVTNHEVFGYFADRYGFEILGVIIPGGSTLAEPSAEDLADLARQIDERGVPAIFAETSSPTRLADALAAEGTDVEVVELYSESLGEPGSPGDTYIGMIRTNAERIAAALSRPDEMG
jgi:zinc/manganese transport system substrate-binding protein